MIWFETFPERLAAEVQAFRERGMEVSPDPTELAKNQRVVFEVEWRVEDGDAIKLIVVYPDTFPYMRMEVYAPELSLDRHQNPFEKNLCLLDRSTLAWNADDTAASVIASQLPLVLRTQTASPEERAELEVAQGEPITVFLGNTAPACVLVPDPMLNLPDAPTAGNFEVTATIGVLDVPVLRGIMTRVTAPGRKKKTHRLANADPSLVARFKGVPISGRWARLEAPPPNREAAAVRQLIIDRGGWHKGEQWAVGAGSWLIELVGAVFPVEVTQTAIEDGWVFVVSFRKREQQTFQSYLVGSQRLTESDVMARVAPLVPVRRSTVSVAGAGTLGAHLVMELAKAQVSRLLVLDRDDVEAGQIVRWPLGISSVAFPKAEVLAQHLTVDHPFVTIEASRGNLGYAPIDGFDRRSRDQALLKLLTDNVDLVVDATGEWGIAHLLSDTARTKGIPFVSLWATEGALGGGVAVISGEGEGCWQCLMHMLNANPGLLPPHDPAGTVQPRGCATRTFVGANFDLLPIVAQAAREVAAVLCDGVASSYVSLMALEDTSGRLTAPSWRTIPISATSACPVCGSG